MPEQTLHILTYKGPFISGWTNSWVSRAMEDKKQEQETLIMVN